MASLPPKPEYGRDDYQRGYDDREYRHRPPPRRSERPRYPDSYTPSSSRYDRRDRYSDERRYDYDRDRYDDGYYRGRDRGRSPSREREYRDRPRERRGYSPGYDRHRDYPSDHRRSGYSPDRSYRPASRSPPHRRPSPSHSHRSRPYSRSPPPKRSRVEHDDRSTHGNRDRTRSPRRRSRSPSPRYKSHSDVRHAGKPSTDEPRRPPDTRMASPPPPSTSGAQSQPDDTQRTSTHAPTSPSSPAKPEPGPSSAPSPILPPSISRAKDGEKGAEHTVQPRSDPEVPTKPRAYAAPAPTSTSAQPRRTSHSPPRGPRAGYHQRQAHPPTPTLSHDTPAPPPTITITTDTTTATAPTTSPVPLGPNTPTLSGKSPVVRTPDQPQLQPVPLPYIEPAKKAVDKHVEHLENTFKRAYSRTLQSTAEYLKVRRETRRALAELDMAQIDLRAAEGRRRVADAQLEKAMAGVLGAEYVHVHVNVEREKPSEKENTDNVTVEPAAEPSGEPAKSAELVSVSEQPEPTMDVAA